MPTLDQSLTSTLNRLADRSKIWTAIFNLIARWLVMFFLFFAIGLAWRFPSPVPFLLLFFNVTIAYVITLAIGWIVGRKRPYQAVHDPAHLIPWIKTSSFPSGHATIAFATATTVAFVFGWPFSLTIFLFSAASLIAVSRVIVGVHYLSDVIVGALIGVGVSVFFPLLLNSNF